ncbi:MAG TPA: HPr family phosphocarrier protein [Stellaceae bacterium]|jgi:phosphocarrier protein|nr:HPr family phosphocarrier protein [Stellaceae bacterium]
MAEPPASESAAGPAEVRRTVTILNKRGLHARAAARFVKLAWEYDAEITVTKAGASVSGRSIMGLMMLAAGPGSVLELAASGPDSAVALDALAALIAGGFNEDSNEG